MGRIGSYESDENISGGDKIIGTDATTGRSKNYRVDGIASYLNNAGAVSVLGQLTYKFTSEPPSVGGDFHIPNFGDNVDLSNVTQLIVCKVTISNHNMASYLLSLANKKVLIGEHDNPANLALYTLSSITEYAQNSNYYLINLTYETGTGSLIGGRYYGLTAEGLQASVPIQSGADVVEALNGVTPIVLNGSRVEIQGLTVTKDGVSYTLPDPDENANSGQGYILYTDATGNLNWKEFPLDQVNGVFFADPGTFETP
jgi:hypothetical protein